MATDPKSFEDRVAEEHRNLAPLFDETLGALTAGDAERTAAAMEKLRAELESHLAQEDEIYYPALGILRPSHRSHLDVFSVFHRRFIQDLDEMSQLVGDGDLGTAEECFRRFSESFAIHEVHEEEFLQAIEAEPLEIPSQR